MHGTAQIARSNHAIATRQRVRTTLWFALVVGLVLLVFWATTRSMMNTWQQSSTYSHGYLIVPLSIWMAWRQSAALVDLPMQPFWPGLVLVALAGFAWLSGELASAAVVAQFAVIGVIVATVLTVFGQHWARAWAFPLGFLFFAVPFGEGLLPTLMHWTADVTVAALRATGIPVYREGNYFVIPSGNWSIIEACAGARFLIAALAVGCLYAWLQYRSTRKRVVFVALALAVALVSNWARAYAIVLMGHLSDNRIGADHQLWGWLIFGAALFALFAIGTRWSDPAAAAAPFRGFDGHRASAPAITLALAASLLIAAAWPAAAGLIESNIDMRAVRVQPISAAGGWQSNAAAVSNWAPELAAPRAISVQNFARERETVGVYLGVYRGQEQGSELVNTMNQIVGSENPRWRLVDDATTIVRLNGADTRVRAAMVRSADQQLLIWNWYWFAGGATSSDVRIKAQLLMQKLTGRSDAGAWVAIYTSVNEDVAAAERTLQSFAEAMSHSLGRALQATAEQ